MRKIRCFIVTCTSPVFASFGGLPYGLFYTVRNSLSINTPVLSDFLTLIGIVDFTNTIVCRCFGGATLQNPRNTGGKTRTRRNGYECRAVAACGLYEVIAFCLCYEVIAF